MKRLLINPFLHTKHHYEQDQLVLDQEYTQQCAELAQAQYEKKQEWNTALRQLADKLPPKLSIPALCPPTMQSVSLSLQAEEIAQASRTIAHMLLNKEK